MLNTLIQWDCLEVLKTFESNSIDLTVTSPPYDNLRTYNWYSWDFESIAKELYRITKQWWVVVWVVWDATIKGSETGTSFKQALYFKEIGFNLHDTMIYRKANPVPLTHNRYEQEFEYMFVFSKGVPKTFNPIKEPCKYAGQKRNRKYTLTSREYSNEVMRLRDEDQQTKKEKICGNIFEYQVGLKYGVANKHSAIFPEKLAEDHILSWSNEWDTVLDPFAGSWTTLKMAKKNNRNYVGIEISEEYCDIIRKRLASSI